MEDDPLSNPDTSKIVKVTIACAIMVLVVTGAVAGFKVSIGRVISPSVSSSLSYPFPRSPDSSDPEGNTNAGKSSRASSKQAVKRPGG